MRADLRILGPVDLQNDHPLKEEGSPLDTLHWTSDGAALPRVPDTSRLNTLAISDIPLAIDLRQHITDIASFKGKPIGRTVRQSRLVIRDGLALHFDYYSHASVTWQSLAADISSMIRDAEDELADLGLHASYVSVCVDIRNESSTGTISLQSLGEVWSINTSESLPACLMLFDSGTPSLLYLDGCHCKTEIDAINIWYKQATSCLASKQLLRLLRMAVTTTSVELQQTPDSKVSKSLRKDFSVAYQAQAKLSEVRDRTNMLIAQRGVIADYRRLGVSTYSDDDAHKELCLRLEKEYQLYYGEALDIAIEALHATTLETEKRSKSFLELSNMAYNVAIQESLKLLQWVGLAIAATSLLAAVAAIVVALQGG